MLTFHSLLLWLIYLLGVENPYRYNLYGCCTVMLSAPLLQIVSCSGWECKDAAPSCLQWVANPPVSAVLHCQVGVSFCQAQLSSRVSFLCLQTCQLPAKRMQLWSTWRLSQPCGTICMNVDNLFGTLLQWQPSWLSMLSKNSRRTTVHRRRGQSLVLHVHDLQDTSPCINSWRQSARTLAFLSCNFLLHLLKFLLVGYKS